MDNILLILRHTKKQLNNDIKYKGIINAFKRQGFCVWYTYSEAGRIFISNGEQQTEIGRLNTKLKEISRNTSLYRAVYKHIKTTNNKYKFCYIRSIPVLPGYIKMLKVLKKSDTKIAVEIPTYPMTEEIKTEKPLRKVIIKLMERRKIKASRYTDLYLPMGENTDKIYQTPAVNIENGVEADFLAKREYKPVSSDEIHMLAVAKIARWHGYNRIIEGMRIYYEQPHSVKVYFHLVGPDGDGTLAEYKKKIAEYGLEKYILLEGPKYGDEADKYFDMADIGIASLNIHGIKTVYPLKIVEYLARGIPFVHADIHCQVRPEWEFCMSVPNDTSPINIEEIIKFSKKVNGIENISDKMRKIALSDCSWDKQTKKMLDYFNEKEL